MKKMIVAFLCLALVSLACLDSAALDLVSADQTIVATCMNLMATTADATADDHPTLTNAPQLCAAVIAETAENLRAGADLNARIIDHMKHGDVVQVINRDDSMWWRVAHDGREGFARSLYLQIAECAP